MKHNYRGRVWLCVIIIATLTLAGCAAPTSSTQLTASIYPVYCMLKQLTIGLEEGPSHITVGMLATSTAGCAHDYQITSADRALLAESALVAINGAGMEPYLDAILPTVTGVVVDTSTGIALIPGGDIHGEYNPHTWLDPDNAMRQMDNLAAALVKLLPSQAGIIEANRDRAIASLTALDAETAAALAPYKGAAIVTFHPAFEYFAKAYGLTVAASITNDPDSPPTSRELARVVDIVRDAGITTIFAERESDSASAEIVARETGAAIRYLTTAAYPVKSVADVDVYATAMRANLTELLEAFR